MYKILYIRLDKWKGNYPLQCHLNGAPDYWTSQNGLDVIKFIEINNSTCEFIRKENDVLMIEKPNYFIIKFKNIEIYNLFLLLFLDKMLLDIEISPNVKYWCVE